MKTLTDKLKPYVQALETAAAAGDRTAIQIINLYQMHVKAPNDPGAPALCAAMFNKWIEARQK